MITTRTRPVVFLPGAIMPAAAQFAPLLKVLNNDIQPVLKDLEVYSADKPAPDYNLSQEVEGLRRTIDAHNFESFHLVAYSGGGAVALAFVATYPELVNSLALTEPAVIPSPKWLQEEDGYMQDVARAMAAPPAEQLQEFIRVNLRPGVQPAQPPPGDPPAWMAKRPAGLKAMLRAFNDSKIDLRAMHRFQRPVYVAIGSLSNPVEERKARAMSRMFSDFRLEVYEGRHHFDPPQRAEPERYAKALLALWDHAGQV